MSRFAIEPAGMSYERALEIAVRVHRNTKAIRPGRRPKPVDMGARLTVLHADGCCDVEIAELIDVSLSAVITTRISLGLTPNKDEMYSRQQAIVAERIAQAATASATLNAGIRKLHAEGHHDGEIGELLSSTRTIVGGRRRAMNLPSHQPAGKPRATPISKEQST